MTSKNASLQQQAARKIDLLQPELLDLSHRIHGYKEIGFNEFQSVAAIVELLDAQGYTYTSHPADLRRQSPPLLARQTTPMSLFWPNMMPWLRSARLWA